MDRIDIIDYTYKQWKQFTLEENKDLNLNDMQNSMVAFACYAVQHLGGESTCTRHMTSLLLNEIPRCGCYPCREGKRLLKVICSRK
jgi:hypothetical protein